MNSNINYVFFEEYKKISNLCNDMSQVQNGVTEYINELEKIAGRREPEAQNVLRQLKRMRHLRNLLAHGEGTFEQELCSAQDVEWIRDFHQKLLTQTDPLALYNQKKRRNQSGQQAEQQAEQQGRQKEFEKLQPKEVKNAGQNDRESEMGRSAVIVGVVLGVVIWLILWIIYY